MHPNHFKEERAIKKIVSLLTVFCIFLHVPAGYSDIGDLVNEGKELIKYSQQLIDKGQMMQAFKDQDKVWLVDQGHQMLKKGMDIIETGEMMYTDQGKSNTQQVGEALRNGGNLLLKMHRMKKPLTEKDKEKIVKQGSAMAEVGEPVLDKFN